MMLENCQMGLWWIVDKKSLLRQNKQPTDPDWSMVAKSRLSH
jgi:hypothetical protein